MTHTPSECAKMGSQRSREVSAEIKRKNIKKYLENPKLCKKCNSIIPYEKRRNNFCKMSCAASIRNIGVRRHGNPRVNCLYCGDPVKSPRALGFCCISHGRLYNANNKLTDGSILSTKSIRRYLIVVRGHKCEQCKLEEWFDNPIPLDLHHLDGNRRNNLPENLKLICKNCHGITESYAKKLNTPTSNT